MRSHHRGTAVAATTALFALAAVAAEAPVSPQHARALAATCTTCHTRGGAGLAAIPPLEGRPAPSIATAMRAFRSGERTGTVMPQLARGYTDADIDALAQWFAAQR
jgi:cytochrome c553